MCMKRFVVAVARPWPGRSFGEIAPISRPIGPSRPLAIWRGSQTVPSPRVGGCTFAEDPTHDCAEILPLWSAAVDPCVLRARVTSDCSPSHRLIDFSAPNVRVLCEGLVQHIAIDHPCRTIRIDLLDAPMLRAPIAIKFEIADDDRLHRQIEAVRLFRSEPREAKEQSAHLRQYLRLEAIDARREGRSLREIADLVLGPGEWPGHGEYRKSHVRRLIAKGEAMIAGGPEAIL